MVEAYINSKSGDKTSVREAIGAKDVRIKEAKGANKKAERLKWL
jgi:hypothetical protein